MNMSEYLPWVLDFAFPVHKIQDRTTNFINALLYSFTAVLHKYSGIELARFILILIKYILYFLISLE